MNKDVTHAYVQRINITGIGSELQGVGRLSDGRVVFVPGTLPGEVVEVELTRDAGRFCEARLQKVIVASPERTQVSCHYASRCGGCAARHMSYAASLKLKRQRVVDALERIGGISSPVVYDTLGSAKPERYRNKGEFAVEMRNGEVRVGCLEARSHKVLPLDDCLLQRSESIRALKWFSAHLGEYRCAPHIRYLVTRVNRNGQLCVIICCDMQSDTSTRDRGTAPTTSDAVAPSVSHPQGGKKLSSKYDELLLDELRRLAEALACDLPELVSVSCCELVPHPAHALDGTCKCLWGSDTFSDTLLGLDFELSPQSFLQVNPEQAETLYQLALTAVGLGDEKDIKPDSLSRVTSGTLKDFEDKYVAPLSVPANAPRILDAYCGVGTITLAAAARGADCVGIEIVAPAIENARCNAERNGLTGRVRFICGDAARKVPRLIAQCEHFDAAILDPPRHGADASLLHALVDARIPRIAYVSCNPATLARDIRLLCECGYAMLYAQPVDMFPWTAHIETLCHLALNR